MRLQVLGIRMWTFLGSHCSLYLRIRYHFRNFGGSSLHTDLPVGLLVGSKVSIKPFTCGKGGTNVAWESLWGHPGAHCPVRRKQLFSGIDEVSDGVIHSPSWRESMYLVPRRDPFETTHKHPRLEKGIREWGIPQSSGNTEMVDLGWNPNSATSWPCDLSPSLPSF